MGTKKSTRAARRHPAHARKPVPVISHQPGKGLVVSTAPSYPETVQAKIVSAKSIIQACLAAHDNLDGENYDIRWPLGVAVALLEDAADKEGT
jgi:hypothetical protein